MPLTTLDPVPALVVIDLQKGIVSSPVADAVPNAAAWRRHSASMTSGSCWLTSRAAPPAVPTQTTAASIAAPACFPQAGRISSTSLSRSRATTGSPSGAAAPSTTHVSTPCCATSASPRSCSAGVSTNSGVESTARSAHDHGYHVVLATDAMADPDPGSHRHSLMRVFPKLGETAATAEITNFLDRRP